VASQPTARELLRWSESLASVARTGLAFTASVFEAERYEEILHVAGDVAVALSAMADDADPVVLAGDELVGEWMREIPSGMDGYRTPRVSVGAIVGNDRGELLLIKRPDSGRWLYPTGWADVGYSAAEIAVKEVGEETGLRVEPLRLAMVLDGLRIGTSRTPIYSLVFHCRLIGGELRAHPLECADVGWFDRANMPEMLGGATHWMDHAFAVLRGETTEVYFDRPREPVWRGSQPERPSRK
jgi:ADP-ribose pyrophosphatase YjhB (NUDIX family)